MRPLFLRPDDDTTPLTPAEREAGDEALVGAALLDSDVARLVVVPVMIQTERLWPIVWKIRADLERGIRPTVWTVLHGLGPDELEALGGRTGLEALVAKRDVLDEALAWARGVMEGLTPEKEAEIGIESYWVAPTDNMESRS